MYIVQGAAWWLTPHRFAPLPVFVSRPPVSDVSRALCCDANHELTPGNFERHTKPPSPFWGEGDDDGRPHERRRSYWLLARNQHLGERDSDSIARMNGVVVVPVLFNATDLFTERCCVESSTRRPTTVVRNCADGRPNRTNQSKSRFKYTRALLGEPFNYYYLFMPGNREGRALYYLQCESRLT